MALTEIGSENVGCFKISGFFEYADEMLDFIKQRNLFDTVLVLII
jgi:hypothetical protein